MGFPHSNLVSLFPEIEEKITKCKTVQETNLAIKKNIEPQQFFSNIMKFLNDQIFYEFEEKIFKEEKKIKVDNEKHVVKIVNKLTSYFKLPEVKVRFVRKGNGHIYNKKMLMARI